MFREFGYHLDGVNYLSLDDIIYINEVLIKAQTPDEPIQALNQSNLESSQARPGVIRYYEQTENIFRLSSVLIESLI